MRTREKSDRRLAQEYFGPLDAMMARYSREQLRQFEAFVVDMRNTMDRHLKEEGEPLDERSSFQ